MGSLNLLLEVRAVLLQREIPHVLAKWHLNLVRDSFDAHEGELREPQHESAPASACRLTATTVTTGIMPQPSSLMSVNGSVKR